MLCGGLIDLVDFSVTISIYLYMCDIKITIDKCRFRQ